MIGWNTPHRCRPHTLAELERQAEIHCLPLPDPKVRDGLLLIAPTESIDWDYTALMLILPDAFRGQASPSLWPG